MAPKPLIGDSRPPNTSREGRDRLVAALKLDLVGPWSVHPLELEQLPNYTGGLRPSNWYLTGFIVPPRTRPTTGAEAEASDDLEETPDRPSTAEESGAGSKLARRCYFPSSIGLSFLISTDTHSLDVTVRCVDYVPEEIDGLRLWRRIPREESVAISLPPTGSPDDWAMPRSSGLNLRTVVWLVGPSHHENGMARVRSVSVSLMNRRNQDPRQGPRTILSTHFSPKSRSAPTGRFP